MLWLTGAYKVALAFHLSFNHLVQLLPIAADLAVAVAVYVYLGRRGADEGRRVAGFALVMLGPVFVAISGYHGQLDSVAMLTGVLALIIWSVKEVNPPVGCGLACWLGIGGLLERPSPPPGCPVRRLLPVPARGGETRERGGRALWRAACLPFLLAEPAGFKKVLVWSGVPGRGGLSLILDPAFASERRLSPALALAGDPSYVANWVSRANGVTTIIVLLALTAFLVRYRPAPIDATVLLWLSVYVFSVSLLAAVPDLGLPFFIMAGYLRETALFGKPP